VARLARPARSRRPRFPSTGVYVEASPVARLATLFALQGVEWIGRLFACPGCSLLGLLHSLPSLPVPALRRWIRRTRRRKGRRQVKDGLEETEPSILATEGPPSSLLCAQQVVPLCGGLAPSGSASAQVLPGCSKLESGTFNPFPPGWPRAGQPLPFPRLCSGFVAGYPGGIAAERHLTPRPNLRAALERVCLDSGRLERVCLVGAGRPRRGTRGGATH
jgi:hypothetical protein